MSENGGGSLNDIMAAIKRLEAKMQPVLLSVAEARRRYMRSKNEADRTAMVGTEQKAAELLERQRQLAEALKRASGLPQEVLDQIERGEFDCDPRAGNAVLREDLVEERVQATGIVDDSLADGVQEIRRIMPAEWLAEDADTSHRLDALFEGKEYLSLVKGLRSDGEFPRLHRLRQMIRVSEDYLFNRPCYDHFAGATLVPQLAQLGANLHHLKNVGGNVIERLKRMGDGKGEGTDATLFELLVAAGCARMGRRIELLPETAEKSPDIQCYDPHPLVIECKRKRVLSDYELAEEAAMRRIFEELEAAARTRGMNGRFEVRLNVEFSKAPLAEIAACLIRQRLTPHPERELEYDWGTVAYNELPYRVKLPGVTRCYSPNMLMAVFGWNSDLPEWDGIVCRINNSREMAIDEVKAPIAMVWRNSSNAAVHKRAWSPLDLFGSALKQIPPGDFGIVYLAHHEGTRQEVANRRTHEFLRRIKDWEHDASIRVPISFLIRLYPRPLHHGNPDMIENTLRLCSGAYGEPALFNEFPNLIFTPEHDT